MATEKDTTERFFDFGAHGKFGLAWEYGEKIYGQGHYGDEEVEWDYNEFGFATFGITKFGSDDTRYGIYQKRTKDKKPYIDRQDFYVPGNPKTAGQTTQRNKMTPAWVWYNGKTDQQKKEDQKNGSKIGLTGPQYSMKIYLLTH